MATMASFVEVLVNKIARQAAKIALVEAERERQEKRADAFERQLWHEQEHHEHTALRNQTLQLWKDRLEQQCLAARAILCKAANYTDVAIAFELADLSREFFGTYPDLYLHDDKKDALVREEQTG